MTRRFLALALVTASVLLSSCEGQSGKPLAIALIGSARDLSPGGIRMSEAARYIRAATADGLVGLDAEGQVTPGLAERWIVTDDGRSYIFRLADRKWPDGSDITSETARDALRANLREARATALGLDLAVVRDIRAMAARVIEIRLTSPMPEFLQLLAQPELALRHKGQSTGRMSVAFKGQELLLTANRPSLLGQPELADWKSKLRPLNVRVLPAPVAVELFDQGETDVVLGGQVESLPLGYTGPLSRGNIRVDGVLGLFGLQLLSRSGFLADAGLREALAMAIDRSTLMDPFNLGGWSATTRIVPKGLAGDLGTIGERWADLDQAGRKAEAARRVSEWRRSHGDQPLRLTLAFPVGRGADMLFGRLKADFAAIGVTVERRRPDARADARLVDTVARIADARWFLNQFNCGLRRGICSPAADARVAEAASTPDPAAVQGLLAEAEAELLATNAYIPFGAPLRWSLVRGTVSGFAPNRLGFHPLAPFATVK